MSDRARQELLGYLLGALDDSETESLEARLQADPELRRALALVRRQLKPLQAAEDDCHPPPGLARRTCEYVMSHARQLQTRCVKRPALSPDASPAGREGRLSLLDMAVAASVLFLAGMVVLPAVNGSRFQARLVACQDNLRQLGASLHGYSQRNQGYFPEVPRDGRFAAAGVYAPTLVSSGLLDDSRLVVCPDSPSAGRVVFQVPSLDQLQGADEQQAAQLRVLMGGSYGYCIGHLENGAFVPTRNLYRERFAIMSDAPNDGLPSHQTSNHGGRGQNVLFEDGHVVFLTTSRPCESLDDIFHNDHNRVAAGEHRNDSVIAPSGTAPVIYLGGQ
jgi:hypothetical protein